MFRYSRGQKDLILSGYHPKGGQGTIEYSEANNKPSIKMIQVQVEHRKKGIGKALIHELQRRYPKEEIDWGHTTEEGEKFRNSLKYIKEPTEHYNNFQELENLRKNKKHLEKVADSEIIKIKDENERMAAYEKNSDEYNEINSKIAKYEENLDGKKPYHKIIDTGDKKRKKKSSY